MTNGPKSAVLYTGITSDLRRRVWQHKNNRVPGFTSRYGIHQLVYYECFVYPDAAITREKELKAGGAARRLPSFSHSILAGTTWRKTGRTYTNPVRSRLLGDPSPRWKKRGASG